MSDAKGVPEVSITILRNTGVSPYVLLAEVLDLLENSYLKTSVLVEGVCGEYGTP